MGSVVFTSAVYFISSTACNAEYIANNSFSIILYLSSALCQTWDQNPIEEYRQKLDTATVPTQTLPWLCVHLIRWAEWGRIYWVLAIISQLVCLARKCLVPSVLQSLPALRFRQPAEVPQEVRHPLLPCKQVIGGDRQAEFHPLSTPLHNLNGYKLRGRRQ